MRKQQTCGDDLAVASSALCMLHCLTPVPMLVLPDLLVFHDESFHTALLLIIFPVGIPALWSGYRHYLQRRQNTCQPQRSTSS